MHINADDMRAVKVLGLNRNETVEVIQEKGHFGVSQNSVFVAEPFELKLQVRGMIRGVLVGDDVRGAFSHDSDIVGMANLIYTRLLNVHNFGSHSKKCVGVRSGDKRWPSLIALL